MTNNIEINCAEYELKRGSIGHSQAGSVFRCTISPVSGDLANRLDAVAQSKGTVRLLFPNEPLLLESVKIERVEPTSVRIVGRIVVSSPGREERLVPRSPNAKGLPW
jgi:hypothetical protein